MAKITEKGIVKSLNGKTEFLNIRLTKCQKMELIKKAYESDLPVSSYVLLKLGIDLEV